MINLKNHGQGLVYNTAIAEAMGRAVASAKVNVVMQLKREASIKVHIYAPNNTEAQRQVDYYQSIGYVVIK